MDAVVRALQSWGVPIGMSGVYAVLAWSSDSSNTAKAWMAIGLGFVFVVWWTFRLLTEDAALTRAVAVGDATRVLALTERALKRRRRPRQRAPYLVYRALGHELRGDWAQALAALDELELDALRPSSRPTWTLLATSVRIAALTETGEVAAARQLLDEVLAPVAAKLDRRLHAAGYLFAGLATGRVLVAEARPADARVELKRVVDDIRATASLRATALFYLARLVEADEPARAVELRAELAKLVPEDAWLRRGAAAVAG